MSRAKGPPATRTRGEQAPAAPSPVLLQCLGGKPAPAGLAEDLRAVLQLPEAARATLWSVLGPCLLDPVGPDVERQLDAFCRMHRIERDALARPVNGCRFLLREAARSSADRATFAADVRGLCDDAGLERLLGAGFDAASRVLRKEILQRTLADHGKLLLGVEWRMDSIQSSSRGSRMRVPVALLTLRFQEGDDTGRITVQVLPETLRQLRETLPEIAP